MNVVIIDGQGGQLGAQLVKELSVRFSDAQSTAIGTNVAATSSMIKAGAKNAATGSPPTVSRGGCDHCVAPATSGYIMP